MSKALSLWDDDVGSNVSGVDTAPIRSAVLWACRDFCKYTKLWYEKHAAIDVVAVEAATDLAFVAGSPPTITSTTTEFDATGNTFAAGMTIVVDGTDDQDGSADNDREFVLSVVATNTLSLTTGEAVTAEAAGNSLYIGAADYALTSTSGEIAEVRYAEFDGQTIYPVSLNALDSADKSWRHKMTSAPTHFIKEAADRIRLVYCPNENVVDGLVVWINLMPLRTATTVEDFLYNQYFETIADGAAYRLLSMAGQPWGNLETSAAYGARYTNDKNKAWHKGRHGFTYALARDVIA